LVKHAWQGAREFSLLHVYPSVGWPAKISYGEEAVEIAGHPGIEGIDMHPFARAVACVV
jgi:hypothetical protein